MHGVGVAVLNQPNRLGVIQVSAQEGVVLNPQEESQRGMMQRRVEDGFNLRAVEYEQQEINNGEIIASIDSLRIELQNQKIADAAQMAGLNAALADAEQKRLALIEAHKNEMKARDAVIDQLKLSLQETNNRITQVQQQVGGVQGLYGVLANVQSGLSALEARHNRHWHDSLGHVQYH